MAFLSTPIFISKLFQGNPSQLLETSRFTATNTSRLHVTTWKLGWNVYLSIQAWEFLRAMPRKTPRNSLPYDQGVFFPPSSPNRPLGYRGIGGVPMQNHPELEIFLKFEWKFCPPANFGIKKSINLWWLFLQKTLKSEKFES